MKFSTSTLLLGTAFVAVPLGFFIATVRAFERYAGISIGPLWSYVLYFAASSLWSASLWLPLVFLAYAAGARRLTVRMVILLTSAEFAAFCAAWYFMSHADV